MKFVLDKDDIICLLKSKTVPYEKIDEFSNKEWGHFIGGFDDRWEWNTAKLRELSEEQLFSIYYFLKNYWKQYLG